MPNSKGLPGWFPDDFAADEDMFEALSGDLVTSSEEGGIAAQMGLANAEGIAGQLVELARSPAWVGEKRDPHGQWTKGGASAARRAMSSSGGPSAMAMRRAQANRQAAHTAVAERIAEEKASKALEVARRELDAARRELEETARTRENAKHRAKLASHALLVLGGAILAAILAHFDVSPVIAAASSAMPLLATELTDWKKKLLWT